MSAATFEDAGIYLLDLESGEEMSVPGGKVTYEEAKDGTKNLLLNGSSKTDLNLAYEQKAGTWNVYVNDNANNTFGFYNPDAYVDEDVVTPDLTVGKTKLKMGSGNDLIHGISLAGDGSTIDGGEGTNVYHFANDVSGDEANAAGITIIDGRGSSFAQATATWTLAMGEGADTVEVINHAQVPEGTLAWTDYNAGEGDALLVDRTDLDIDDTAKLEAALVNDEGKADGTITVARNEQGNAKISADLATTGKSNYHVILQNLEEDGTTTTTRLYYAGQKASVIDATAEEDGVVIIANNNQNEGDTIYGGAKADIIVAGQNDKVNGGVGDDTIYLGSSNMATQNDGTTEAKRETVVLDTRGDKDTVFNFGVGHADTSDIVELAQGYYSLKSITSNGTDITLTATDNSALTLVATGQNQTSHMQDILVTDGDKVKNVGVVQSDQWGYVYDDIYDVYTGSNSKLDFQKYTGVGFNLAVDLGNTGRFGDKVPEFYGINYVIGMNADNNTLVGAAGANNTLASGANSYSNSIWGGGQGRDSMVGADGAVDTFFYGSGDDMDTVASFNVSEDRLYVHSGKVSGTSRTNANADYIRFAWDGDVNNVLTVNANSKDADTALVYTLNGTTNRGIKVGITDKQNTFTYEDGVDAYFGGEKGDTLNVATSSNKNLWLDGRTGDINTQNIATLNASASSGNLQLAGDAAANMIIGGAGQNSIWGGDGATSDTLQGGSGKNSFYFGAGEGSDVITSYNDGDKVMLYNVTTSALSSAALSGNDMVIDLKDGSKLTVQNYSGSGSMSFQLADGTYLYDKDQNTWVKQD